MFVRGVTLFELLMVLLLAALITALAVPAYRRHLVRVNRSEATASLYAIASAEERHYLRHGRYTGDVAGPAPAGLGFATTVSRRYALSVAVDTEGQTFIASATPTRTGGQDSDGECLVFSLDHRGRRAVSGTRETAFCWR
jgi:type IV pilus assembly protein PilE